MARTNKYTSVNFNDIYEKKFSNAIAKPNNPSPPPSNGRTKTIISNSRIQGNMLVLTRPTPKPISIPPGPAPPPKDQDKPLPEEGGISLRPQGRTGSAPNLISSSAPVSPLISPSGSGFKTNKFVPPHLRPGFVGREEKPVVGPVGPGGRPKSGGGYERGVMVNTGRGVDPGYSVNRYGYKGTRPNSSG